MKRSALLLILLTISPLLAQNLQINYDFGEGRKFFTSTLEMYKPDDWGATFWFVDMDYNTTGNRSVSLTYWEIARYIKIPKMGQLSATVQYNDGYAPWGSLGQVWLGGVSHPLNLGFITLPVDLLYRSMYGSDSPDFQVTVVFFKSFLNDKLTLTGFVDVWTQDKAAEDGKNIVFLTEPQLWYNVWQNLHLGGEIEFSYHFLPSDKFEIMPTLGMKWNF